MIRYLGTDDDCITPSWAIGDWTTNNKNHTHLTNESHLAMVEEKGMGHAVSPGEKEMMKAFFHDPEFVTQIHP